MDEHDPVVVVAAVMAFVGVGSVQRNEEQTFLSDCKCVIVCVDPDSCENIISWFKVDGRTKCDSSSYFVGLINTCCTSILIEFDPAF